MMKDAPIVILDEATSYTDPENEAVIQRAVNRLTQGKTLIVIAHRLSTITEADQIAVIEHGNRGHRGSCFLGVLYIDRCGQRIHNLRMRIP